MATSVIDQNIDQDQQGSEQDSGLDYSNPAPVYPDGHSRTVQYPHPIDPMKQGAVVAFPDTLSHEDFSTAAKNVWEQLKSSASRFAGSASSALGGPEHLTGSGADTMQALRHPLDKLKTIGQGLVNIPAQQA